MNQYTVPQFIDVEDKIFGPITIRQFIILLIAGLISFIAFRLADLALFAFILALVGGAALVLAFAKINGQTFHYFLLNIFGTLRRPSRRVWNRSYKNSELKEIMKENLLPEPEEKMFTKQVTRTHIRDLSLMVNTGGYYKGD